MSQSIAMLIGALAGSVLLHACTAQPAIKTDGGKVVIDSPDVFFKHVDPSTGRATETSLHDLLATIAELKTDLGQAKKALFGTAGEQLGLVEQVATLNTFAEANKDNAERIKDNAEATEALQGEVTKLGPRVSANEAGIKKQTTSASTRNKAVDKKLDGKVNTADLAAETSLLTGLSKRTLGPYIGNDKKSDFFTLGKARGDQNLHIDINDRGCNSGAGLQFTVVSGWGKTRVPKAFTFGDHNEFPFPMTKIKLVHRRLSGNEYMLGVYVSDWGACKSQPDVSKTKHYLAMNVQSAGGDQRKPFNLDDAKPGTLEQYKGEKWIPIPVDEAVGQAALTTGLNKAARGMRTDFPSASTPKAGHGGFMRGVVVNTLEPNKWKNVIRVFLNNPHRSAAFKASLSGYDWGCHSAVAHHVQGVFATGYLGRNTGGKITYSAVAKGFGGNDRTAFRIVQCGKHYSCLQVRIQGGDDGVSCNAVAPNQIISYELSGAYERLQECQQGKCLDLTW